MRDWKPCRKPLLLLHIIAVKCASGVCFFFLRDCFESWGDFISYGCVFNFLEFVFIFLKSCISVNSAIISISNLFKFLITPITSLHCPGPQKAALDGSKTVIFAVSSNHTETWWDWNSFKTWVHSSRFWVVASFFGWFYASSFVFLFFVALQFTFLNCFCAVGDELNDEAGSRAFQSHGRPQSQFEDRMWMQSRWTSKRRSRIRKSINRKNLNLRKNLVKFIWWVHCLFLVLYKYLFVCYSTDINLFKI